MNTFFKNERNRWIVGSIGLLVLVLVFFRAGMTFGYHRALYRVRGGENYERNFLGRGIVAPQQMRFGMMTTRNMEFNSHGASGSIISVQTGASGSYVVAIRDQDGTEKSVIIGSTTPVRKFMDTAKPTELKENDIITVIGTPNESGQIYARFVRVFPPRSASSTRSQ